MNEEIFSEIKDQLRPDPKVRASLFEAIEAIDAADAAPAPLAPRGRRRLPWVAAAVVVAMVGVTALATLAPRNQDLSAPPVFPQSSRKAVTPGDYAQAYAAVQRGLAAYPSNDGSFDYAAGDTGFSGGQQLGEAAAVEDSGGGTWETNTQVAGIDEGDIVKSDGRTIFTASGNDIVLVSADGAATAEVARIDTGASAPAPTPGSVQGPVTDLMLHGNSLVALVTEYAPRLSTLPGNESVTYVPYDATETRALVYDVSEPSSPKFVTSLGQSGAYVTSRLAGSLLYLVTAYAVVDPQAVEEDDPITFVPAISEGGSASPVAVEDLTIPIEDTAPSFQVISSINLNSGQRVDTAAVMGRADVTYMSDDNLFLAASSYEPTDPSKFSFGQDLGLTQASQTTDLVRVALADGELTVAAEGTIPGLPLNQFALDEYEGHLRVAVTIDGTTKADTWAQYPTLLVLDDTLNVVGSLPRLAVNETIQSVRFQGPTAYLVSFRQIDPLFALDLSSPTEPKVMSELKIPGFSTYLHPWADGRLLGLGMDATDNGLMSGMKLSMFDTSDPFAVTEATTIKVPYFQSEALRNHKAVFVDVERGLIGFATDNYAYTGEMDADYLLYHYDEATGFELLDELPVPQSAAEPEVTVRGLTITNHLYVVSTGGVDVYDADSLTRIASHTFTR